MINERLKTLKSRANLILSISKVKLKSKSSESIQNLLYELKRYQIELEIQNEELVNKNIALESLCAKYEKSYESLPVSCFVINENNHIKNVNQAGADLLALPKADILDRRFSRFITIESQAIYFQYQQQLFKDLKPKSFEIKMLRWNGPVFCAAVKCSVVNDLPNNDKRLLISIADITDAKIEKELIHNKIIAISAAERQSAMKNIVLNIANEQSRSLTMINNYINGCIFRLQNKNLSVEGLLSGLKKAAEHSLQLYSIIHKVKKITLQKKLSLEYSSINNVISEAITLLSYEFIDYPIDFYFDPVPNLPDLKIDKVHIQQVILSLARNAIEVMKQAKTCEPKIIIETTIQSNNMLEISIIDNGPGFDVTFAEKLFEPHFTTKVGGVGLGLTQSMGIIKEHNGILTINLNASVGACAKISLPFLYRRPN